MDGGRFVEVVWKEQVARDITAFRVADGRSLAPAPPGSHIDVCLPSGTVRQYSLIQEETRAPAHYEFAVLREADGRGGSVEIVDQVGQGDRIEISEPRSNFELDTSKPRYLLLGAGVGITPLLAMAQALQRVDADFVFHICAKTAHHVAFKDRIDASPYAGRVTYHFSEAAPSSRLRLKGLLASVPDDAQIYACGPDRFLDEIARLGADWPVGRLRVEHFVNTVEALPDELAGEFTVELRKSEFTLAVPADKSILEALVEAGIAAPSQCKEGVCGTCVIPVLAGEIIHRDACLYEEEHDENSAIACCVSRGHPGSTIVLDM